MALHRAAHGLALPEVQRRGVARREDVPALPAGNARHHRQLGHEAAPFAGGRLDLWLHVPSPSSPSVPASECSTLDSGQLSLLERFATSSGKHSPPRSWSRSWKAASWIRRLSGLTCPPSTLAHGAAEWIASLPACPASPTAPRASKPGTRTGEAGATGTDPSRTSSESWPSVAPPWSSSRTSQPGLWGDSFDLSEKNYADWVTSSKDLASSLRATLALRISVSVCSSWPTTTTRDEASSGSAGYSTESGRHSGTTLTDAIRTWTTPTASMENQDRRSSESMERELDREGRGSNLAYDAYRWKTPHGMAGIDHTGKAGGGGEFAAQVERWASPRTSDTNGAGTHGEGGMDLRTQADTWPSPMARDHKGGGVTTERKDGKSRMDMLDWRAEAFSRPVLSTLDGRELSPTTRTLRPRLNPAFAAWLMGLPGWWTSPAVTSSARSAMEPYRCALRSQLELLLGERSSGRE